MLVLCIHSLIALTHSDKIEWETVLEQPAGTVAISEASPVDPDGLSATAMLLRTKTSPTEFYEEIRLVYVDISNGIVAEQPFVASSQYVEAYAADGINLGDTVTDSTGNLFTPVNVQWSGRERSAVPVGGCAPIAQPQIPPYAMQMAVVRRGPPPSRSINTFWSGIDRQAFGVGQCALSATSVSQRIVLACSRGFTGGLPQDATLSSVFVAQLNGSSVLFPSLTKAVSKEELQVSSCACNTGAVSGCSLDQPLLLPDLKLVRPHGLEEPVDQDHLVVASYASGAIIVGGNGLIGTAMAVNESSLEELPGLFPKIKHRQDWSVMSHVIVSGNGQTGAEHLVVSVACTSTVGGGWQTVMTAWSLHAVNPAGSTGISAAWVCPLQSSGSGACSTSSLTPRSDDQTQRPRLHLSESEPFAAVLLPSSPVDHGSVIALVNITTSGPVNRKPLALASRLTGELRADDVVVGGGGVVSVGWLLNSQTICAQALPQNGVFVDQVQPGGAIHRLWSGCPSLGGQTRLNATLRVVALGESGQNCLLTLAANWIEPDTPIRGSALFSVLLAATACSGHGPLPSTLPSPPPTPTSSPSPSTWPSRIPTTKPAVPTAAPAPHPDAGVIGGAVGGTVAVLGAAALGLMCWRRRRNAEVDAADGYSEMPTS